MKRWIIAIIINTFIWNMILGNIAMYPRINDDFKFGGCYQPNQTIVNRTEGYAVNYTNNLGFVDDDFMPNQKNILIIGDSVTEGNQVLRNANYTELIETGLNQLGIYYFVHNLGIKGKNAADYIAYGPAYLEFFNPEYVIVQLSRMDLADSYHQISTNAYINNNNEIVPYTHFDWLYKIKNKIVPTSPLFFNAYMKLKQHLVSRPNMTFFKSKILPNTQDRNNFDYVRADNVIDLMKETYGEKLIILYMTPISLQEQVEGLYNDSTDQQYGRHLEQYCLENHIAFINPAESFISHYQSYGLLVNGFDNTQYGKGHLNQEGHKVLSKVVLSFLEPHLKYLTSSATGGQ